MTDRTITTHADVLLYGKQPTVISSHRHLSFASTPAHRCSAHRRWQRVASRARSNRNSNTEARLIVQVNARVLSLNNAKITVTAVAMGDHMRRLEERANLFAPVGMGPARGALPTALESADESELVGSLAAYRLIKTILLEA